MLITYNICQEIKIMQYQRTMQEKLQSGNTTLMLEK